MKGDFFMNNEKNKKIWLEKVHTNLTLRNRSEATYYNYKSAIIRFLNFYDEKTIIKKLKEEDILIYLQQEYIGKEKSAETYNVCICAIRLLYLVCFNISLNRILLPNSKVKKRLPTILPKNTFLNIFNNEDNLEHQCWLILGFCCGLRVDEVATIKIENIYSKDHKLKVLGKGNKERFTILPDVVIKALRTFYKEKKYTHKTGYLFKGYKNKDHINNKTIINYFTSLKKKYNLNDNITFHSLRHSFATYYLMNGGSLLALQSMLGHEHLSSTIIYIHISQNFNELEGIKYV